MGLKQWLGSVSPQRHLRVWEACRRTVRSPTRRLDAGTRRALFMVKVHTGSLGKVRSGSLGSLHLHRLPRIKRIPDPSHLPSGSQLRGAQLLGASKRLLHIVVSLFVVAVEGIGASALV